MSLLHQMHQLQFNRFLTFQSQLSCNLRNSLIFNFFNNSLMENNIFHITSDEHDRIAEIEMSGFLALENAQIIKEELIRITDLLGDRVKITISAPEEMDISFVQLLVAFIRRLDEVNVKYQLEWNIDEDQKFLLEHVGLGNELFMNN